MLTGVSGSAGATRAGRAGSGRRQRSRRAWRDRRGWQAAAVAAGVGAAVLLRAARGAPDGRAVRRRRDGARELGDAARQPAAARLAPVRRVLLHDRAARVHAGRAGPRAQPGRGADLRRAHLHAAGGAGGGGGLRGAAGRQADGRGPGRDHRRRHDRPDRGRRRPCCSTTRITPAPPSRSCSPCWSVDRAPASLVGPGRGRGGARLGAGGRLAGAADRGGAAGDRLRRAVVRPARAARAAARGRLVRPRAGRRRAWPPRSAGPR